MNFTKKLLLSAALIIGVVAAGFAQTETHGDYTIWTGTNTGDIYVTTSGSTGGLFGLTKKPGVGIKKSKFVIFLPEPIEGTKTLFYTNDGGVTFFKIQVEFGAGAAFITNLIKKDTAEDLFNSTEIAFAVDGKVYRFGNNGIGAAFKAFDTYGSNPFGGASENPFGSNNDISTSENWTANLGVEELNPFNLDAYIKVFLKDATLNGIDVSHVMKGKVSIMFDATHPHIIESPQVIAFTTTLGKDKEVNIIVNPTAWLGASPAKRLAIIYHELGHDIFNFEHASDKGPLMSVYAKEDYTYDDLFELKTQMFNDYKNGVVYSYED